MTTKVISAADVAGKLSWKSVTEAMAVGHRLPQAQIQDSLLGRGDDRLLSRAAWVDGLGLGVKSASVFPGNGALGLPSIHAGMMLFNDKTGALDAVIDGQLVTNWKTAGDSVLGATLLARRDAKRYLVVGAGTVSENLIRAYHEMFPGLEGFQVYNRTQARAEELAAKLSAEGLPVTVATDLEEAAGQADIISTATMAKQPVLLGDWVRPGTHVDLIGAFTPDMREADDDLLRKGRIFVDSRKTAIHDIGELLIPIEQGVISEADVIGDYYDLVPGKVGRESDGDITVFKNGGGAHLDLMTAKAIVDAVGA